MRALRNLGRCRSGATAAEFAMVLPLLLILIFGLIDAGRLMWTINRGQKAAQVGVRVAVVTDIVPAGLKDYTFVSASNPPGSPTVGMFGSITCQGSGNAAACSCTATPCDDDMIGTADDTAFAAIVARIQNLYPELEPEDLKIVYQGVGLGYAGNPHGSDISPMVSLEIGGARFTPLSLMVFGAPEFDLPPFQSSMTLEDGAGLISN